MIKDKVNKSGGLDLYSLRFLLALPVDKSFICKIKIIEKKS